MQHKAVRIINYKKLINININIYFERITEKRLEVR